MRDLKKHSQRFQFFLVILTCLFFCSFVEAKDSKMSKEAELKFSIESLKESAAKVRLENKKLKESIRRIPNKISAYKQEMRILEAKKSSLLEAISKSQMDKKNEERELSFAKTGIDRLNDEYKVLVREEQELDSELTRKKKQVEQMESQIEKIEKHIIELENKFVLSDNREQIVHLKEERISLEELLRESEYDLQDLQAELAVVRKKNSKPLQELEILQRDQDLMKQKMDILGDEYQIVMEEGKKLQNDILRAEQKNIDELKHLEKDLVSLNKKKEELKSILEIAQGKLSGKKITIADFQEEEARKKKSIELIRKEKEDLQSEILFLENAIKQAQEK